MKSIKTDVAVRLLELRHTDEYKALRMEMEDVVTNAVREMLDADPTAESYDRKVAATSGFVKGVEAIDMIMDACESIVKRQRAKEEAERERRGFLRRKRIDEVERGNTRAIK